MKLHMQVLFQQASITPGKISHTVTVETLIKKALTVPIQLRLLPKQTIVQLNTFKWTILRQVSQQHATERRNASLIFINMSKKLVPMIKNV